MKLSLFFLPFFIILDFCCFSGESPKMVNHSLASNYAIPSASDSADGLYGFQAGMFADGKAETAWVTGLDMDDHWALIKWKNRRIDVDKIEIDFEPLELEYRKGIKSFSYEESSESVKVKTVLPAAVELAIESHGKWEKIHAYENSLKWDGARLVFDVPEKCRHNVLAVKLSFRNSHPGEIYAVREVKVTGPEFKTSFSMRPNWKGLWIWGELQPQVPNFGIVKRYFRKVFDVENSSDIESAILIFAAHDRGSVFINGTKVLETKAPGAGLAPELVRENLDPGVFHHGKNLIALKGEDIYDIGLRGVIYELHIRYKNGETMAVCSDASTKSSSMEEDTWNSSTAGIEGWKNSNVLASAGRAGSLPGIWKLDYPGNFFGGNAEITGIKLVPELPRPGEKYRMEVVVRVPGPLKEAYGIIAGFGYDTPVRINLLNYSLCENFIMPENFLPKGFRGEKTAVFEGVWPDGTPGRVPVTITICNAKRLLDISGTKDGQCKYILGKKQESLSVTGFPGSKVSEGRLSIDGKAIPPILYTSSNDSLEHFRDWLKTGVKLFRILPQDANSVVGCENENELHERLYRTIEATVDAVSSSDPDVKFMISLGLNMPNEWKFNNPESLIVLGDKTRLINVSSTNDTLGYMQESPNADPVLTKVRNSLKKFIKGLEKKPYASKIIGVCLMHGRAGENYWGLNVNAYQDFDGRWVVADRQKFVFGDYGVGFRNHFRDWLELQYSSPEDLAKAWKTSAMGYGDVTDSGKWPIRRFMDFLAWSKRPDGKFTFRDRTAEGWLYHDFVKHQNEARPLFFMEAAKAIKEASGGKLIVGGYIGYTVPNLTNSPPALAQHTGHLAMKLIRECPYFDFACSPHFYHMRRAGDPVIPHSAHDSLRLNGKLWINEFDSRTYLASIRPKTFSVKESREQFQKEFAFAFTKGQGWWWLEFPFKFTGSEAVSWFADPMLQEDAAVMKKSYEEFLKETKAVSNAEIAVFLNEEQGYYMDAYSPANTIHSNLINYVLPSLQKTGAPYDFFAQGDLAKFVKDDFYKNYKLIIFLNAFHISSEERKIINEKLKKDGRTLLFFYAPGYQGNLDEKDSELSIKGIENITGMKGVARIPEMHMVGMNGKMPDGSEFFFNAPGWWDEHQTKHYGKEIGPVFYLDKNFAGEKLAYLTIDGKVQEEKAALGRQSAKDYTVWYATIPYLSPQILAMIIKESGVHRYSSDPGTIVYANKNYLAVHSGEGKNNMKLDNTEDVDWVEVFENKVYGENTQSISVDLVAGETKVFELRRGRK